MNNLTSSDISSPLTSTSATLATTTTINTTKDNVGVICSALCLAHCLLLPLLLATGAIGSVGALLANEQVHMALLVPVIVLAALSFPAAYKQHNSMLPITLGSIGLITLLSALFLGEQLETPLTVTGAVLLIIAHLSNRNLISRSLISV